MDDLLKDLEDRVDRTIERLREVEAERSRCRAEVHTVRANVKELRTAAATLVGSLDEAIRELRRDAEDRSRRKTPASESRGSR